MVGDITQHPSPVFPIVSIPSPIRNTLAVSLLLPDPLQQAIHCDGHSLDLRVHPLLRAWQPRARRMPLHHRVCPEDNRLHQPAPRMPHLLHLCLQGVHLGQGETFVTKIFHLNSVPRKSFI